MIEFNREAMRNEIDRGPAWSDAEREEIDESIRFDDYMELWGDLDPTGSGFQSRQREGA